MSDHSSAVDAIIAHLEDYFDAYYYTATVLQLHAKNPWASLGLYLQREWGANPNIEWRIQYLAISLGIEADK